MAAGAGRDVRHRPAFPRLDALGAGTGYEALRTLGRGGMGVVYVARAASLDRKVALKFLPPGCARDPVCVQALRREALTASALNHPDVCPRSTTAGVRRPALPQHGTGRGTDPRAELVRNPPARGRVGPADRPGGPGTWPPPTRRE